MAEENTKVKHESKMRKVLLVLIVITALVLTYGILILGHTHEWARLGPSNESEGEGVCTPPDFMEMDKNIAPNIEEVEVKMNESVVVKGYLIKLLSIDKEGEKVKIEIYDGNETTESAIVVLPFYGDEAVKYKNIAIAPLTDTIEDDRVTLVILPVAY